MKAQNMTARELESIASTAFGPEWKTPLSVELDVTRESVWRYATERTPIPSYHVQTIRDVCAKVIKANIAREQKVLSAIAAKA